MTIKEPIVILLESVAIYTCVRMHAVGPAPRYLLLCIASFILLLPFRFYAPFLLCFIAPQLFRPPGGSFSQRVIDAARAVDSRVVLWDVDPMDWKRGRTPGQIVRAVLKAVRPGAIIELHDGGPNPQATLAALPRIITGIRAKGLRLVALGA